VCTVLASAAPAPAVVGHTPGRRVRVSDLVIIRLDSPDDASEEHRRECADVLYCALTYPPAEAWLVAARALDRYPGCALVVVPQLGGGCVAWTRPGLMAGSSTGLRGVGGPSH
jgi:hypothetical protein